MNSIREVFDRLEQWKAAEILLQITVHESRQTPLALRGKVFAIYRSVGLVDIIAVRKFIRLEIAGAAFKIGNYTLEASRPGDEHLVFEVIEGSDQDHSKRCIN